MKKLLTVTALYFAMSGSAFALCNGIGNCDNEDNDFIDNDNTNTAVGVGVGIGYGGAGGQGGQGGAGGLAIQGQQQGQIGINDNDIENKNKQRQSLNNDIDLKNKQKQQLNSDIDVKNRVSNEDYTNVGVHFAARKREASSAIAAALVANGCFGSMSGGAQGTIAGLSIGGTYESENCIALRTSARFQELSDYYFNTASRVQLPVIPEEDIKIGKPLPDDYVAAVERIRLWTRTAEAWEQAAHNALCEDELSRNAFRGIELLQCEEDNEGPAVRNYAASDPNKGEYHMLRKKGSR